MPIRECSVQAYKLKQLARDAAEAAADEALLGPWAEEKVSNRDTSQEPEDVGALTSSRVRSMPPTVH
jgi:hypothetical protein